MGDFKYFCNTDLNNGETITIPAAPEAKRLYFNFKSDPLDKDMDMANNWQEEWGPPPVVGKKYFKYHASNHQKMKPGSR